MSILPPNKPQKTVDTPKNFFIYGATMNGKSYLAGEFPNPLFLDTDGNASANPYPSIPLRNIRGKNGKIAESVIDQLDKIITELQTTRHTYETIVIDVIDDVVSMIETYFCDREGVETIGDIGYGKGHAAVKQIVTSLAIEFKALPLNVIYVSRIAEKSENNITYEIPSLQTKFVNIINGNCDYMIQAKKVGKNYIRTVKDKRKNYQRDELGDDRILAILDAVSGAFDRSQRVNKTVQDKIVKQLEKAQEEAIVGEVEPEVKAEAPKPVIEETKPESLDISEKEVPFLEEEPEVGKEPFVVAERKAPPVQSSPDRPVSTRKRPVIK